MKTRFNVQRDRSLVSNVLGLWYVRIAVFLSTWSNILLGWPLLKWSKPALASFFECLWNWYVLFQNLLDISSSETLLNFLQNSFRSSIHECFKFVSKIVLLVGKRFKFIKRLLDDWITQNHLYQLNKRRVIIRRNKEILPHYWWLLDSWIHFGLTSINFEVLTHFFNFVPLIGTRRFWMLSNMNHTADNG